MWFHDTVDTDRKAPMNGQDDTGQRPVYPLAIGQNPFRLAAVGNRQVQFLELAIQGCIVKGNPLDLPLFDHPDEVVSGEIFGRFVQ